MIISIITLFPNLFTNFLETSIVKRALEKNILKINIENMLHFSLPKVRVDAPTVGPGPGMLIKPDIIKSAICAAEERFGPGFKIFFTPQGDVLNQTILRQMLKEDFWKKRLINNPAAVIFDEKNQIPNHLILCCGRYEGFDDRAQTIYSNLNLSIGNYVLLGGDLPAQVFLEAFLRLLPNVVGNEESVTSESFESPLLDHPQFCKPDVWEGLKIPEVLLSGNHQKINDWRENEALKNTVNLKFDWFRSHLLAKNLSNKALSQIPPHYLALMHTQVKNQQGESVTTTIKSMDLHDISRTAQTYGFKGLFIVQPLKDQQIIAKDFCNYWTEDKTNKPGITHQTRQEAVELITIHNNLSEVLEKIKFDCGKPAVTIATTAKQYLHKNTISYHDQSIVWKNNQPVLILLGTGYGLEEELILNSEFVLKPIEGMTNYNHLSVRCAAAIILDRWLGINSS